MSKSDFLNAFKQFYSAMHTKYGSKWGDGSLAHNQGVMREWGPTLSKTCDATKIYALAEQVINDDRFKNRPPMLQEVVDLISNEETRSIVSGITSDCKTFKDQVDQVIRRFVLDHGTALVKFDFNDPGHIEKVNYWTSSLEEAGITDKNIVLNAYYRFKKQGSNNKFAPQLLAFIDECKSEGGESAYIGPEAILKDFYHRCEVRYGSQFTSKGSLSGMISEWMDILTEYGVDDVDRIKKGCESILKNINYASFAPKPGEIGEACLMIGSNLPEPDLAFQIAVGNVKEGNHPLIALTRKQVGSYRVKNGTDSTIRREFMKAYRENCIAFITGNLTIKSAAFEEEKPKERIKSAKTDLLAKLKQVKDKL